ncbi:MAG: hypothetical protein JWN06_3410 [Propionibacteriaceae bacterium]|jgi:hypothetical protein|nr:hypothetical protein [Propionibacteriaceae bacterium]
MDALTAPADADGHDRPDRTLAGHIHLGLLRGRATARCKAPTATGGEH